MPEFVWILFLAQLPTNPSSLRVNVWRRLREAGSTSLQNGVWVLAHTVENKLFMERLLAYIKQNGAGGQIFLVQALDQSVHDDLRAHFKADRDEEYAEFLEQCESFIAEIEKETHAYKFSFAELEENEQNLNRLRKWIAKIQMRDFFKTQKSQAAITAFQNCRQSLQNYTRRVYQQEGIEAPPEANIISEDSDPTHQEQDDERQ